MLSWNQKECNSFILHGGSQEHDIWRRNASSWLFTFVIGGNWACDQIPFKSNNKTTDSAADQGQEDHACLVQIIEEKQARIPTESACMHVIGGQQ